MFAFAYDHSNVIQTRGRNLASSVLIIAGLALLSSLSAALAQTTSKHSVSMCGRFYMTQGRLIRTLEREASGRPRSGFAKKLRQSTRRRPTPES